LEERRRQMRLDCCRPGRRACGGPARAVRQGNGRQNGWFTTRRVAIGRAECGGSSGARNAMCVELPLAACGAPPYCNSVGGRGCSSLRGWLFELLELIVVIWCRVCIESAVAERSTAEQGRRGDVSRGMRRTEPAHLFWRLLESMQKGGAEVLDAGANVGEDGRWSRPGRTGRTVERATLSLSRGNVPRAPREVLRTQKARCV